MRTHYGPWQPCWISNQHQKHKSGRGLSSEHFWQVWLISVQRFQRRFKCEKLTDDGRTLTHDKSSHGLWPGELKNWPIRNKNWDKYLLSISLLQWSETKTNKINQQMYKTIILLLLAHKYKTDKIIALHTTIKHDNNNSIKSYIQWKLMVCSRKFGLGLWYLMPLSTIFQLYRHS